MEDRRILIADTAIAVIAEDGIRGLTHRAVDKAAGLPTGSTSYYARSKAQLVGLTVERLASLLRGYTEYTGLAESRPESGPELVETLESWLTGLYTDYQGELRARAALMLELEQSAGPDATLLQDALLGVGDLEGPASTAQVPAEICLPLLSALEGCLWEHCAGRLLGSTSTDLDHALLSAVVSLGDDGQATRRGGALRRRR